MSHVRVDGEMHRRVMNAVSKALDEKENTGANAVKPAHVSRIEKAEATPVRRKAKVSVIRIISIAACCIIVAGGAVMFAKSFFSKSIKTESFHMAAAETTAAAINEHIDNAVGGDVQGAKGNKKDNPKTAAGGEAPTAAAANEETTQDEEKDAALETTTRVQTFAPENKTASSDYRTLMPFKVKTVGSSTYGENSISAKVYTGENGEKAIVFSAKEGIDLIKAYFPQFKGTPALLQTEGGQVFYGIDTSVGINQQVGTTGPYDAVAWTKNGTSYMLVFNQKTDVTVLISIMEKI